MERGPSREARDRATIGRERGPSRRAYEVTLLGGFGVRIDGVDVPPSAWRHKRARELVCVLALAEGRRVHREELADLLWPALPSDAAAANLRKAVHFARTALGSAGAVDSDSAMVELLPTADVVVDAVRFEQLAAKGDPSALELYGGDLLPEDRYTAWVEDRRDRLRLLRVELLRASGQWERLLAVEPADEEAHRQLMARALDAGDRATVVRLFEQLRERLRADIGVGPGQATIDLYQQALSSAPRLPSSPAQRVRGLLAQALVHLHAGEWLEADRAARAAKALAVDAGLGREVGEACAVIGIQANIRGVWKETFRVEVLDSVQRYPALTSYVYDAHLCLAEYSLAGPSGQDVIRESAADLRRIATTGGSAQGVALADLLEGEVALATGALAEADGLLTSATERHEATGGVSGQVLGIQRLAELALVRGDRSGATALVRHGLTLARTAWLQPHLLVRLYAVLLETSRSSRTALSRIDAAERELSAGSVCPACSVAYRVAEVRALARSGEVDAAQRRLVAAERLAGMWPGGEWQAAVWEARAVVRRAEGHEQQAVALLAEAAAMFDEAGRPLDRDRCRDEAGVG